MSTWILLGLPIVILLIGYGWYVSLVSRRNRAREALSSIDVQLRKRHELLPNELKLAQKFMTHERGLLEQLTELRSRALADYRADDPNQVGEHLAAERELQSGMIKLFAVAENYPELRSSETVLTAQETFTEVEGHISAARRFYNSAVTDLNNAVQIFPGSLLADIAKVQPMPFFEIEEAARRPVDVDDYLS
jgi:LemA protein